MPKGQSKNGKRIANPNKGKVTKCTICGHVGLWKHRFDHAMSHEEPVNCAVDGCKHKYKNQPRRKKAHFELFHEAECRALGYNFKPKKTCELLNCKLCRVLLAEGKQRYTTNNATHMKRHIKRAEVKRHESLRVACKVIENGITCTKKFSDGDGLRRHLCGRDGVTTGRAHSAVAIKKAYPKIRELVTRKVDPTRTMGKIRREFTNAQKHRRVEKEIKRRNNEIAQLSPSPRKYKKIRKDYKTLWLKDSPKIEKTSSRRSDRGMDRRNRYRAKGAGRVLSEPIKSNQKLLLRIAEEMTELFEHVGYHDIARNFDMELEFLHPPIYWTIDPDDETHDLELKRWRVQYYFTQYTGPLKKYKWRVRQASSAAPQTYLEKARAVYYWNKDVQKTFLQNPGMTKAIIVDEKFYPADGGSLGSKSRVLRPVGGRTRKVTRTATQPRAGHSGLTVVSSEGEIVFAIVTNTGWNNKNGHEFK